MQNRFLCPDCKKELIEKKSSIVCSECKRLFGSVNRIPILLPKNLSKFKIAEKQFYSDALKHSENFSFEYVEKDYQKDSFGLLQHFAIFQTLSKHIKILELAAGNGQYGLILKKKGFKNVVITDITPNGLIAAREYAKKNGLPYENSFFAVDAENLPFEDNTFDVIFITAALHHLESIPLAINEIQRCLKSGGINIIAIEPNKWYFKVVRPLARLLNIRLIQTNKETSIADEKTRGVTMRELEEYLKDFELVQKQRVWYLTGLIYYLRELLKRLAGVNVSIPRKSRFIAQKIDKIIEKIPGIKNFSFHITVIAKK